MAKGFKTGGRRVGSLNKSNVELKQLAQQYTAQAIETLAEIMQDAEAPYSARITAANSLLDRGHGKPTQALELGLEPSEDTENRNNIIAKLRAKHLNQSLPNLV